MSAIPAQSRQTGTPLPRRRKDISSNSSWRRVNVGEARQLLERPHLKIFDMRDQTSFVQGHIRGAEYLSNENLEAVLLKTPRHVPVLIYCYHGNASQSGAKLFADFGFQEVYDLVGGYESWRISETQRESDFFEI